MERRFRLVLACPDRVGIVAMVSNFISSHGGSISDANQHTDSTTGWFLCVSKLMPRPCHSLWKS